MKLELISKTTGLGSYKDLNSEEIVSAIARHGSIKDDNGKLITYLMNNKHYSPLQHISFGFKITTSRAISAQAFRHKSLEFQEFSQRYSEVVSFEDIELRMEHKTNRQSSTTVFNPSFDDGFFYNGHSTASNAISGILSDIQDLYSKLIEFGVAKECARMILPMASTTEIHITGNLRNLLGFLNVRCDEHSQKEIQDIAFAMGEAMELELPNVFGRIDWRNGLFM